VEGRGEDMTEPTIILGTDHWKGGTQEEGERGTARGGEIRTGGEGSRLKDLPGHE